MLTSLVAIFNNYFIIDWVEVIMPKPLEKEFQYYLENQDELVKKYNGKFIVIKACEVIGVFDSQLEVINMAKQNHEPGTFLVHKCEPGEENYTQRFHSRVRFA